MKDKPLKYIGYYAIPGQKPLRSVPLAGRNKMDYTVDVISKVYGEVEIISPAYIKLGQRGCRDKLQQVRDKVSLRLFSMLSTRTMFLYKANIVLAKIQLLLFLLKNTSKDEIVLVYHSLIIAKIVLFAKRIRNFRLVLELNEIYSDVTKTAELHRDLEMKVIDKADAFLFPNELMNKKFNAKGKPYAVEYGVYKIAPKIAQRFDDGKIHVVYAGTLDPAKGGAAAAVAAAAELPSNYHIHVLGFGTDEQISYIKHLINEVQSKSEATITYDGILDGDKFIAFLQKCHIGLSTQNPNAKFNDTSFPSKILTYLANGLQVVSIDIPAISKSRLCNDIVVYQNQEPQDIAQAILSITDFTPKFELLKRLDNDFKLDIENLLRTV